MAPFARSLVFRKKSRVICATDGNLGNDGFGDTAASRPAYDTKKCFIYTGNGLNIELQVSAQERGFFLLNEQRHWHHKTKHAQDLTSEWNSKKLFQKDYRIPNNFWQFLLLTVPEPVFLGYDPIPL